MIAYLWFVLIGAAILVGVEFAVIVPLAISDWRADVRRKRVERAYRIESAESEIGCIEGMLAEHEGGDLPLSLVGFRARLLELRAEIETLRGAR